MYSERKGEAMVGAVRGPKQRKTQKDDERTGKVIGEPREDGVTKVKEDQSQEGRY